MDQSVMDRYIDEMQKMYKIAKAKDPNYVTAATTPALPGTGYLVMQVTTMRSTYPVQGAKVTVYQGDYADGNIVAQETTDENGKTNLGLKDVNGELLLISQFTLYADCRKGNRPSFIRAGSPDMAEDMYEYIIRKCRETVPVVEQGIFGADMKVELLNDGPFTLMLDSEELFAKGDKK